MGVRGRALGRRRGGADPQAGRPGGAVPDAFERILNSDLDQIIKDWHDSIRRSYLPLLAEQREARELATPLVVSHDRRGGYNVAPSVSPDGR